MTKPADLGRYKLIELLGKGGFGTVYLAKDQKLNREVALKLLNEGLKDDALQRFNREASICTRLRHPNIITIYDASVTEGRAFIVMERLKATELADLLDFDELSEKEALSLVVQVANALDYLHGEGILHRDIKPQNIMVTEDGRAVLMDFNLGVSSDMTALTATGIVVGTPRYMAPELWFGEDYTPSTEVYSLGLIFHHMLTGVAAPIRDMAEIKKGGAPVELPSKVKEGLTPAYDKFVAWTTSAEAAERCPSIHEFLVSLTGTTALAKSIVDKYNPEISSTYKTSITVAPKTEKAPVTEKSWRPLVFALVLISILALVAIEIYVPKDERRTEEPKVLEVAICPFADGCFARLRAKLKKPPRWQVLDKRVVTAKGICKAKGRYWTAQVEGLSGDSEKKLCFYDADDNIFSKLFRLKPTTFAQAPRARVGVKKVLLSWQLHKDVEADVVGTFKGERKTSVKKKGMGQLVFDAPHRAFTFDYDISVGDRVLASHSLRLGCISRRNLKQYPNKPDWKVSERPVLLGKDILLRTNQGVTCMGIDCGPSGPVISRRWQVTMPSDVLDIIVDSNKSCLAITRRGKNLNVFRFNAEARKALGPDEQAPVGHLPAEWNLKIPTGQQLSSTIRAYQEEPGLILVSALSRKGRISTYIIDYRTNRVKSSKGPVLGSADDLWLGRQGKHPICISTLKGVVLRTLLGFRKSKALLEKREIKLLFEATNQGMLTHIGALKVKNRKKKARVVPELVVDSLSNNRWVIRSGQSVAVFRLENERLFPIRSEFDLPASVSDRNSRAMELDNGKIAFGSVTKTKNLVTSTRAYLVVFDLKNDTKTTHKIGRSVLLNGYEAICGGVGYHEGNYYLPALEHVHVISKSDGSKVGEIYCEWRPNYAIPVETSLFVPLNIRKLLAMDFVGEF